MAVYFECTLVDLGYVDGDGNLLASIEGRDNCGKCKDEQGQNCCCFRHLGTTGYPEVEMTYHDDIPGVSVIGAAEALPDGGEQLTKGQFLARLVSAYGWPEGTTIGEDGRPHGPTLTVADSAYYSVD